MSHDRPQSTSQPDWLSSEGILDQAPRRALYPYPLLNNILSAEDCRAAVVDEAGRLEEEFGSDLMQPVYQLIWRLNTISDVFTSHFVVSPPEHPSPFAWASHFVAAAITILPRQQDKRHSQEAAAGMAGMLARLLSTTEVIPRDTAGWHIRVFPSLVDLAYQSTLVDSAGSTFLTGETEERVGYGHEIVVSGSAGTRRRAAERWSRAVEFVCKALSQLPEHAPYQHFVVVNGERAIPGPSVETHHD